MDSSIKSKFHDDNIDEVGLKRTFTDGILMQTYILNPQLH